MLVWVHDILASETTTAVRKLIEKLKTKFKATDLGGVKDFLGMSISRTNQEILISQSKFIDKMLRKFNLPECNGTSIPMIPSFTVNEKEEVDESKPFRQLIGSLIYIATTSRPDIIFATSFLSRFPNKPTQQLWTAGKRVLSYLKETKDSCLVYKKRDGDKLSAHSDADWAGDKTDRKSVSGSLILHAGNTVIWSTRKQSGVALSTAEAQYVACAHTAADLMYLSAVMKDLNGNAESPQNRNVIPKIFVDNQSAISMAESYEYSSRSRHMDIKFHFIKDLVCKNLVSVEYVNTDDNVSDIFTKPLPDVKFTYFRKKLNLK